MNIYILWEDGEVGPFERSEIFAKLKDGTLTPEDQARCEGNTEWETLDEVMKGGSLPLFSIDQLDKIQAESPAAPVVIPDFQPSRSILETEETERKRGVSIILVSAALLLIVAGIFVFHSQTTENSNVLTVSASPTPMSIAYASQGTSQPDPSVSPTAIQQPESTSPMIQSLPDAAPISTTPTVAATKPTVAFDLSTTPTPPTSAEHSENQQPQKPLTATPPTLNATPTTTTPTETDSQLAVASNLTARPTPLPVADASVNQQPQKPLTAIPPSPDATPSKTTPPSVASQPTVAPPPSPEPTPIPFAQSVFATDFFRIESVQLLKKESKSKIGIWKFGDPKAKIPPQFIPCLELKLSTKENTRSDQTFAKAYFFDDQNKLITCWKKPSPSGKPTSKGAQYEMPVLFYKNKPDSVFFEIPPEVKGNNWKAVLVFGDKNEAHAASFPSVQSDALLDYPEKQLVHEPKKRVARKPAMDPLIQYEVKTRNPRQPKITLFLRPPKGISDVDDVKGVLSLCILAGGIDDIKRKLQKEEMDGDYTGLLGFANKHKLAILAWGSNTIWNSGANYEDLPKAQAEAIDKSFDLVADAWERGVHELGEKYGIPQKNFLLWGSCGSAQWAHRLCLRKPDYFLAIDIHIPGSFDKPTPEASKVIWCLTTGELYGGYDRSMRFVAACKKLGYPIIYKAIVGLGHAGHPDASAMVFKFFEYALTQKEARDEYDKKIANKFEHAKTVRNTTATPWPEAFQNPPFYGDIVNQEKFPSNQENMIPESFRTPLPTKEIADIWARSH